MTPGNEAAAEGGQLVLLKGEAVLARAVGWHLEDRVIVHQNSTIVFS